MPNAPKTPARAVRIDETTWAALDDAARNMTLGMRDRDGNGPTITRSDVIRLAIEAFLRG